MLVSCYNKLAFKCHKRHSLCYAFICCYSTCERPLCQAEEYQYLYSYRLVLGGKLGVEYDIVCDYRSYPAYAW